MRLVSLGLYSWLFKYLVEFLWPVYKFLFEILSSLYSRFWGKKIDAIFRFIMANILVYANYLITRPFEMLLQCGLYILVFSKEIQKCLGTSCIFDGKPFVKKTNKETISWNVQNNHRINEIRNFIKLKCYSTCYTALSFGIKKNTNLQIWRLPPCRAKSSVCGGFAYSDNVSFLTMLCSANSGSNSSD